MISDGRIGSEDTEGWWLRLRIEVLGPLRVVDDGLVEPTRPSHRRLLSVLALHVGDRIRTERLIDMYWGESPPAEARAALQTHISALRQMLPPDSIRTEGKGYRLVIDGCEIDSIEFAEAADKARHALADSDWHVVWETASKALALWKGSPYPDLQDDDFARAEIVRLEETQLELWEMWSEALVKLGRPTEALPELERLVISHRYREQLWEHLMVARYQLGRYTEALQAYQDVNSHLAELGLEPGDRLRRLEEKILLRDRSMTPIRNNLPVELSSFVGRDSEINVLVDMTSEQRLVTVTGAGGSGKTRLALRAAREQFESFPDGVWLVELASTLDQSQVATEIARTIGLKPKGEDALDILAEATADDAILLILDNCEHLLEGAATTAHSLLQSSPRLKILATTREPLRVPGETVYEVPGMSFPAEDVSDPAVAVTFDAVRLFEQRVAQTDSRFRITDDNLSAVLGICRRLEGMPLAIELAAARVRALPVQEMASRLDDRLQLLTTGASTAPARQQTLKATIEWSYRLLEDDEKAVLDRLSIFRGGFQLEAAERVVTWGEVPPDRVAGIISDLVDKSLVTTYQSGRGTRYRLLETVRQYALARLDDSDTATAEGRHRDWCLSLTDRLWARALGDGKTELAETLELEADNLQAALDRATGEDAVGVVALSQALAWHWYLTGHLATAATTLRAGIAASEEPVDICMSRALLAWCLAYAEAISASLREAKSAHRLIDSLGDPLLRTWVVTTVQLIHFMTVESDPEQMLPLALEAADIALESGNRHAEILARQALADAYCWNGKTEIGLDEQRIALDLAAASGDAMTINQVYGLSIYNFMLDPEARRREPLRVVETWRALVPFDVDAWTSIATDWLPWVYLQAGDLERAEEAVSWMGNRTLEGYNRTIYLIARATVAWMRGDLDRAWEDIEELDRFPKNPRWAHTHYPLIAEVAADRGDLAHVRRAAEGHLAMKVHHTREATKLGVLYPLARAETDAALDTGSAEHAERARDAVALMRQILGENPPKVESWLSIMTHVQNLAFAEAEISRLSQPSVDLWTGALSTADYAYYRIYARWRRSEALLDAGSVDDGGSELREAHADAFRMGAGYLMRRIVGTGARHGIIIG